MGRITKFQNDIGHLQSVLAEKNRLLDEQLTQIKALTKERDDARAEIEALKNPKKDAA